VGRRTRRRASQGAGLSRGNAVEYYSGKRGKRKRRRALKIVLVTVIAVLGVGVGCAWAYLTKVTENLNSGIDDTLKETLTTTESTEPFYMLLLGVDKNQDRVDSSEYGSADSAYRSDTIILARVDPQNMQVTLVSIPRDTYTTIYTVDSDGKRVSQGKQKVNAAYSLGGASAAVATVSELAGVDISHYAEIDFDQFCTVVDQIGGIEVDVPIEIDDSYTGHLDAGLQTLDGDQALILCRSRHAYDSYGSGDFYRAANQRMVISAIVKKILAEDPVTMTSTISTAAESVTCDMSATDIISLAMSMRGLDTDNSVYSGQLPTNSEYVNSTWYEMVDTSGWKTMMERVDAGLSPYSDASEDPTQGVAGTTDNIKNADTSSDSSTSSTTLPSVEVQNGTNTSGLALTVANKLIAAGYTAVADNAASRTHATTLVLYSSDDQASAAEQIASTIGGGTVEKNDGTYSTTSDVLVIVGSDLA
jgi:LCP family protein required for cell wall assembly